MELYDFLWIFWAGCYWGQNVEQSLKAGSLMEMIEVADVDVLHCECFHPQHDNDIEV